MPEQPHARGLISIGVSDYLHLGVCPDAENKAATIAKVFTDTGGSAENDIVPWRWDALPFQGNPADCITRACEQYEEVLFFFTGLGFDLGDDLLLATAEHDPYSGDPCGIKLIGDLLQAPGRISDLMLKRMVAILDCPNDGLIDKLPFPRDISIDYAILGSGSMPLSSRSGSIGSDPFFDAIVKAVGENNTLATDVLERITPASLHSYLDATRKILPQASVFRASMSGSIALKAVSELRRFERDRFEELFRPTNGKFCPVAVNPDWEIPLGKSIYGTGKPQDRGRPPLRPCDGTIGDLWTQEMIDMDVVKHLRDLKYAVTCEGEAGGWQPRDKDLWGACMDSQAVKLTPLGEFVWTMRFSGEIN